MFKEKFLIESPKVDSIIDISRDIESFVTKVSYTSNCSIIAVTGGFGSGKSTFLNNVSKHLDESKSHWVDFEAWKYPDRSDLWEGFITEFAANVGLGEKLKKRLKGNSDASGAATVTSKVLASTLIPGLSQVGELLEMLFSTDPISRLEGFQEVFLELLIQCQKPKASKPLRFILEDIDRSDDSGIHFLETLRHFLSQHLEKLQGYDIKFFVPISGDNFNKHEHSFIKCIDFKYPFSLNKPELTKFVSQSIDRESVTSSKYFGLNQKNSIESIERQITDYLESLFNIDREMSIRKLKLILRQANNAYSNRIHFNKSTDFVTDFRISLMTEAMKFQPVHSSSGERTGNKFSHLLARSKLDHNMNSSEHEFIFNILNASGGELQNFSSYNPGEFEPIKVIENGLLPIHASKSPSNSAYSALIYIHKSGFD